MGSHWRNLVNTTELYMCGGDAALCKITMNTCFVKACSLCKDDN